MFFGEWQSKEDVVRAFCTYDDPDERAAVFNGAKILIAAYMHDSCESTGYVLMRKGKKLFELQGDHCSCYGMEEHWPPSADHGQGAESAQGACVARWGY